MRTNNVTSIRDNNVAGLTVKESHQLVNIQRDILELVVTGNDYQFALEELCRLAEGIVPDALASIMLLNEAKTALEIRSAPSATPDVKSQLDGLVPGMNSGSCGTAVYQESAQFINDTSTDARWQDYRELARDLSIGACWSMPITNRKNELIGSFALSSFEKRAPNKFQENVMQTSAYLASLVLQRESDDRQMQRAAHYDHLTKLPNRFLFKSRVEHAMARANRSKTPLALFFIDLDKFKQVNDEMGHDAGDLVLQQVAERMLKNVRREDSLARIGGDEFILLVEGARDKTELKLIADKIMQTFDQPTLIEDKSWPISASLGISQYPKDGMTSNQLIRCADKAMYLAKTNKKDKVQFSSD